GAAESHPFVLCDPFCRAPTPSSFTSPLAAPLPATRCRRPAHPRTGALSYGRSTVRARRNHTRSSFVILFAAPLPAAAPIPTLMRHQ
ncbi:MAG: hypothetical protein ABFD44_10235, partial [Anaerolineaceae bacterium]